MFHLRRSDFHLMDLLPTLCGALIFGNHLNDVLFGVKLYQKVIYHFIQIMFYFKA
jgi:hypothetical protein